MVANDAKTRISGYAKVVGMPNSASSSTALTRTRLMFEDSRGRQIAATASDGLFTVGDVAAPAGKKNQR